MSIIRKIMFAKFMLASAVSMNATFAMAESQTVIEDFDFSFEGPLGSFDQNQLQRGLKIYTEVCSSCHGLELVSFRNLSDKGGPELPKDQMRAYAKQVEVFDPTLDDGEGGYRAATPADKFPKSSDPSQPDLSLMAKARAGFHGPAGTGLAQLFKGMGGAEYIASLMTGYTEEPECALGAEMSGSYNTSFAAGGFPDSCKDENGHHMVPGSWIAMGQPLYGDDIEFDDGHANDLRSEAEDVAAFLMWTAEPKMMARKKAGLTGVVILSLLSILLFFTNKRLWAPHKNRDE